MSQQIKGMLLLIIILLLAASMLAFDNHAPNFQSAPTPRPTKVKQLPPEVLQAEQGGSTDGVVAIGLATLVIIVVPILLRHEEWK